MNEDKVAIMNKMGDLGLEYIAARNFSIVDPASSQQCVAWVGKIYEELDALCRQLHVTDSVFIERAIRMHAAWMSMQVAQA